MLEFGISALMCLACTTSTLVANLRRITTKPSSSPTLDRHLYRSSPLLPTHAARLLLYSHSSRPRYRGLSRGFTQAPYGHDSIPFYKNHDRPNLFTFDKQLKCILSLLESEASLFQGYWKYTKTLNNPFLVCRTYISCISRFRSMGGGLAGLPSDFRKGMKDYTTLH